MKEGFDKEIDSLLRRLSGASAGSRPHGNGANATGAAAHLDADELSAFAVGSLPAAARVAASEHLADCDECRGLVVNLTRAAGVEGEIEKAAAPALTPTSEPSRLRSWLAALFAPGALRYVAPALALCLVAAVTFVALRSRRAGERERVAQTADTSAPRTSITGVQTADKNGALQSPHDATTDANIPAPSATTGNAAASRGVPSSSAATVENQQSRESPAGGASSSPATDRLDTSAEPASPPKDAPPASPAAEQKAAASETVTVTNAEDQPKAAPTVEVSVGQPQQVNNLSRVEMRQQSPDGSRNQSNTPANGRQNESAGSTRDAAIAGGLVAGNRKEDHEKTGGSPARRARSSDDKRAKTEEEGTPAGDDDEVARAGATRNAAGHKFRRDGGAWVDVNYKPSMSSTGVRRGTDSYRALVADIPELGRVAEQIGGEVVVVVRGRAYRIR
jgi:hypothetical protein